MPQAIHHFPTFFQGTDKRFLKYGAFAFTVLSVYLAFGALALGLLGVLALSTVVLKVKADKMANLAGCDLTAISRAGLIDGGTFQHTPDEASITARAIVLDGGSFERFQS